MCMTYSHWEVVQMRGKEDCMDSVCCFLVQSALCLVGTVGLSGSGCWCRDDDVGCGRQVFCILGSSL